VPDPHSRECALARLAQIPPAFQIANPAWHKLYSGITHGMTSEAL